MAAKLSHQEQVVYFGAQREGYHLVDVPTVQDMLGASTVRSRQLLSSLAQKGAARRVGRGKYALVAPAVVAARHPVIDPYLVLDELMAASGVGDAYYVAFASALTLHHASDQIAQQITVASTRRRHERRLGSARVAFVLLAPALFFGQQSLPYRDTQIVVSDLEKTILDCVHRPGLAGGLDEVARALPAIWPRIDQSRLLAYAGRMRNAALCQRLGYLLDGLALPSVAPETRDGLLALRGKTPVPLDTRLGMSGPIDPTWHVYRNVAPGGEPPR